jgi:pyridoxal phosphate enzyme (YggS family)
MSVIVDSVKEIRSTLKGGVSLLCVSKTHPKEFIEEAYACGERDFAENKVQEMTAKAEELPKDIRWHMIGHLQTNKVKYIASYVYMIHSIDSIKLLETVDKEAKKHNRVIKCLLQVHVAQEETKFGLTADELLELVSSDKIKELTNVEICGLMGMASFTNDKEQIRKEFQEIKKLFDKCKSTHYKEADEFREISMGMSGDYPIAIEEGSTMIRVGNGIFGKRYYQS